jgi:hypothetical protein
MDDTANVMQNLDEDPDYIKFKQDPNTGLLSRMKDIMDKKNMPIEEYREIEVKKTAEMKADFLKSKGQTHKLDVSVNPTSRFGRSGRISNQSFS